MSSYERGPRTNRVRVLEVMLTFFAVVFYLLCFASFSAFANDLAPLKPESRNGDYLKALAVTPPKQAPAIMVFDKSITDEMAIRYNSFSTPYQAREGYQLNGQAERWGYDQANKDLADWALKKLMQYHLENTFTKTLEKGAQQQATSSRDPGARSAAKAAIAVSSVQKALKNTTFKFGETKTNFRYDLPSGSMRMGVTSPILDCAMDVRARSITRPNQTLSGEKLNMGVSRKLDFIEASTNFNYGAVTKTVNYGVSKRITGPLTAAVDHSHYIRDTAKDETVFRLNFGTSF